MTTTAVVVGETKPADANAPDAKPTPAREATAPVPDRRSDVDAKQRQVAALLEELEVDGLLVSTPENFAWLTSGATARGTLDPRAHPLLYFTAEGRWLVSANVDTQRIFDEEIDALGFQAKEWPWHVGRDAILEMLLEKRVASDDPALGAVYAADRLAALRRVMSEYEKACCRALGQLVTHALEATARTFARGDSEREVAGQVAHRLIHRGGVPTAISVAADGRSRLYRQGSYTATPIRESAVLRVVARKYGLHATASRTVTFGAPEAQLRREYDACCKISATYLACTWPESIPSRMLSAGQRVYGLVGAESEWRFAPQGYLTGRAPVERVWTPRDEELVKADELVTWQTSIGAGLVCDTALVAESGAQPVTVPEAWPKKRIRAQGAEHIRPDILIRE